MTQEKMTYVGGAEQDDFFSEVNDVLLGLSGIFTISILSRAFPTFPTNGARICLNNRIATTSGWALAASFEGPIGLSWSNGASQENIFVGGSDPDACGSTSLIHATFDATADETVLWHNGSTIGKVVTGGSGIVPSPSTTQTDIGHVDGQDTVPGPARIAGFAITDGILTPQEISDHTNAVMEGYNMVDTGVWDALWDARLGIPDINDETTEWLDEISAAPVDRQLTTATQFTEAARPRFA